MYARAMMLTAAGLLVFGGCDCSDDGEGSGVDGGGGGTDTGLVYDDAIIPSDAPGSELCEGACACSDGVDNDGDGLIDGMDPECTGPFDNDEGSFATGIPGDNRDPMWQDCFYDGNSGGGDDGCMYRTECLTGDLPPDDPGCELADRCLEFCRARTPNGCDCFGCCDVTLEDGSSVTIAIGPACSIENIDDETACPRCTQNTECINECGTCELCPGRTADDLPAECTPDGGMPMYECEGGVTCMSNADCESTEYCSLGCCLDAPI
jgi:hypothetical protein